MKQLKSNGLCSLIILVATIIVGLLAGILVYGNLASFRASSAVLGHSIFSANSDLIEYHGRWVAASNRLGKLASFPGSSIEFAVYNTSSIILDLANLKKAPVIPIKTSQSGQVALTPARSKTAKYGPVNVLVTFNGTAKIYRIHDIYGKAQFAQDLNINETHRVRMRLLKSDPQSTIHLKAIILDEGGILTPISYAKNQLGRTSTKKATQSRRKSIEILTLEPFPSIVGLHSQDRNQHVASWSELLENRFADITVSMLPISNETCLSHLCRLQNSEVQQVKDIYFRAGAPGTQLNKRLWSSTSVRDRPAALVIMLGLTDMNVFLQNNNGTRHQAIQFIEEFARSYSHLIQIVRRTAYSSSTLDMMQPLHYDDQDQGDESYLYNSAPSDIPIFLIIPPSPIDKDRKRSRYIRTMFSQMLHKVLNELKWHIGDKITFVLDTAGWLGPEDLASTVSSHYLGLTQIGHVKFAYQLSLHLCHYLVDRHSLEKTPRCPFDRHDEYVGNLFVPETASIGKIIEEKKVMKMKEMFGFADTTGRGGVL